ncbi:MAG: PKD domain-containing protein [Gammaproteobacteria bacterium]|nr:PKD domain-containing protein [Gammaproteobacteria bacterium]
MKNRLIKLIFALSTALTNFACGTGTDNNQLIIADQAPQISIKTLAPVFPGEIVRLDGSRSKGREAPIESFLWTQVSGMKIDFSHSIHEAVALFVAPWVEQETQIEFALSISDSKGQINSAQIKVTVLPIPQENRQANYPPIAIAGVNQEVNAGEFVTLDGSASTDIDGSIVEYMWQVLDGTNLDLDDVISEATTQFTAPIGEQATTIKIALRVTDNDNEVATSEPINIRVRASTNAKAKNIPPIANAGSDTAVRSGNRIDLSAKNSKDIDGIIKGYHWVQRIGPAIALSVSDRKRDIFFNAPVVMEETDLVFDLTVVDDKGLLSRDSVTIKVRPPNQVPIVVIEAVTESVIIGAPLTLDGFNSDDPDGHIIRYDWQQTNGPSVELDVHDFSSIANFIVPSVNELTELEFKLIVTDNDGATGEASVQVLVSPTKAIPIVDAGVDQSVFSGDAVLLNGNISREMPGVQTTQHWTQTNGQNVKFTVVDNQLSFVAPSVTETTVLGFQLIATNSLGYISRDEVLITIIPLTTVQHRVGIDSTSLSYQGQPVVLRATMSGEPNPDYSYQWTQRAGPAISFNPSPLQKDVRFVAPVVDQIEVIELEVSVFLNDQIVSTIRKQISILPSTNQNNLSSLTVGDNHACVLSSGQPICWGSKDRGLNILPKLNKVSKIVAGTSLNCALSDEGLNCWGHNMIDGKPLVSNIRDIKVAGGNFCALAGDNILCWGSAFSLGSERVISITNLTDYAVGTYGACMIDAALGTRCWGRGISTDTPALSNAKHISIGTENACAIEVDGNIVCWRLGSTSPLSLSIPATISNPQKLAVGGTFVCALSSQTMECFDLPGIGNINYHVVDSVPPLNGVYDIAASARSVCAQDQAGIHCWGDGMGSPSTPPSVTAATVIAAGNQSSCVIDNGDVKCWGGAAVGRSAIDMGANAVDVKVNDGNICVLLDNSSVQCWGDGSLDTVPALTNPVAISNVYDHVCAIDTSGVVCWGSNSYDAHMVPDGITNPSQVTVSNNNSCALYFDGSNNQVNCWGSSSYEINTIPPLNNPSQISLGRYSACAIDDTGLVCWGYIFARPPANAVFSNPSQLVMFDSRGCVMDDTGLNCWAYNYTDYNEDVDIVPSFTNVTSIAGGGAHVCAIDAGNIRCWGKGDNIPDFVNLY